MYVYTYIYIYIYIHTYSLLLKQFCLLRSMVDPTALSSPSRIIDQSWSDALSTPNLPSKIVESPF